MSSNPRHQPQRRLSPRLHRPQTPHPQRTRARLRLIHLSWRHRRPSQLPCHLPRPRWWPQIPRRPPSPRMRGRTLKRPPHRAPSFLQARDRRVRRPSPRLRIQRSRLSRRPALPVRMRRDPWRPPSPSLRRRRRRKSGKRPRSFLIMAPRLPPIRPRLEPIRHQPLRRLPQRTVLPSRISIRQRLRT